MTEVDPTSVPLDASHAVMLLTGQLTNKRHSAHPPYDASMKRLISKEMCYHARLVRDGGRPAIPMEFMELVLLLFGTG
ncbi:hypothetical protein GGTG_13914 [Gaeumannomyces tritici R3-111a-1]|uniref:Uncharacterized protein n=1 Tax=Gaeumannomyces tritici (strain R3-111a-1) TaxID=644352 RepID=J3PK67_GAET3|nr:hypothetical protein GGTG_13914 [Gaeumannomyces tritici R3-111a-1]EJT68516.1 hypothetical protein GGTG_13914 [Gaeumannomyces tritici R3-111a-1]